MSLDLRVARGLVSEDVENVIELFSTDETDLVHLQEKLRNFLPPKIAQAAGELVDLRQRARMKFSHAAKMYFTRDGLEVASSEAVARYRASRIQGHGTVLDACCGIGGDLASIAAVTDVIAADRNPAMLYLARANVRAHGLRLKNILAADIEKSRPKADVLFLDPSRREGRKRTKDPEEWSPPPAMWGELVEQYGNVVIKSSPMNSPEEIAPEGIPCEAEYISYLRECKEMVLWYGDLRTCVRRATVLSDDEVTTLEGDPAECPEIPIIEPEPEATIYEPDAALVRSGLLPMIASEHSLKMIDPEIAFLIGGNGVTSPFLRGFKVIEIESMDERKVRAMLRKHDIGKLTVKKRGHPSDAESLRRQLAAKGSREGTLLVTRRGEDHFALLVEPKT